MSIPLYVLDRIEGFNLFVLGFQFLHDGFTLSGRVSVFLTYMIGS